jgi:hypothetical protein
MSLIASATRQPACRARWLKCLQLVLWMSLPVVAPLAMSADSDSEVFSAPIPCILNLPSGATQQVLYLAQFYSQPNEDKTTFLMRVGRYLQGYAAREGFEACGEIWRNNDDTAWVVPVITLSSHIMCRSTSLAPTVIGVSPWVISGETIHVHPEATKFQINAVDAAFNAHLRIGAMQRTLPDHFSAGDLRLGPGYLVAGGRLQYQRDHGKVIQDLGPLGQ